MLPRIAFPIGFALTWFLDTARAPLSTLMLVYGPFAIATYAYAAFAFKSLPRSRHSVGTRFATLFALGLAVNTIGLTAFYLLQKASSPLTIEPWAVRFGRYGFYSDLLLQLGLAWSMVRLLIEDGRHENDDTRAQVRLIQDREVIGKVVVTP